MTLAARIVPALAAACLALHLSVACVPNKVVRLPNTSSWSSTGNDRNDFTQDCTAHRRVRPVVACFLKAETIRNDSSREQFGIAHINATLCTHLVYSYVELNQITKGDTNYSKVFESFRDLKKNNPDLKITVAVGGHDHKGLYSAMARNNLYRRNFTKSAVEFLGKYQLDGLDLDWRDPASQRDKRNYVLLCQELYQEFEKHCWQLTVTITRKPDILAKGYDLAGLARHTDYFYLLTYEYHGQWNDRTGHSAPLDSSEKRDVNFTVSEMISMVPASKLVVGIFLYGLEFSLQYSYAAGIGSRASWEGERTYSEVCGLLCPEGPNWTIDWDNLRKVPYTYSNQRWIAYENEESIKHKIDLLEALNLRGVFVWTLDADAFSGCCGVSAAPYPLLTPIHKRMKVATDMLNAEENALGSIVTCFLDYRSVYRKGHGYFTIEDIDTRLCTHIIYCYAGLDEANDIIVDLDHDYAKSAYNRLLRLKKKNPALVVTVSVGGAYEETIKYSNMVADHQKRQKFIASVVDFVRNHRLDGIDLAWDSPATPEDKENFVLLCQEIRNAFRRMNWLLTVSVSGKGTILDQGYNLTAIANEIDLLHLLAFNYNSSSVTGHPNPLKPLSWTDGLMNNSVQYSLLYALARSVPAEKIILVTNFIGSIYKLTNASDHGLGAPSHEPGSEETFTYTQGIIGFNEVCKIKIEDGRLWEFVVDPNRGLPYMYKDDLWIAYDNVTTIREKASLAKSWKLAGVGAWTVSTDDFRGSCEMGKFPLLTEINNVLGRLEQRPAMAPPGIDEPDVPGIPCSLVEQANVSVALLQCGSLTQQNCIVNGEVPSHTYVLADCWDTTMLAMVCRPDGFWVSVGDVPDQQEDQSAANGDRMKILCQPDQLNSLICGRKPPYQRRPGAFLELESFYNKTENRWPWVVELYRDDEYICVGTIVSAHYLVTAAHCIMRSPETRNETLGVDQVTVKVNNLNLKMKVTEIHPHPDLLVGKNKLGNDIAMLKFTEPVTFNTELYPACVNFNNELADRLGVTFKHVSTGDSLFTDVAQTLSRNCSSTAQTCVRIRPTPRTEFCGESLDEESDLQKGDSGGPFMQDLSSRAGEEQWAVTGVLSTLKESPSCSRSLTLFTAVHAVRGWIMQTSQPPLK